MAASSVLFSPKKKHLGNIPSPNILCYCFRAIWPKGYQRGSLEKSHQNGDFLKQAMRKSYPIAGFEPAAFGLLMAAGSNPVGEQLFRIAYFK